MPCQIGGGIEFAHATRSGRADRALTRLIARIDEAHGGPIEVQRLRRAVRASLPLTPETRRDWRDWLELSAHGEYGSGLAREFAGCWRLRSAIPNQRLASSGAIRAGWRVRRCRPLSGVSDWVSDRLSSLIESCDELSRQNLTDGEHDISSWYPGTNSRLPQLYPAEILSTDFPRSKGNSVMILS